MTQSLLHETFDSSTLASQLHWFCPPQEWRVGNGELVIESDAKTDFWQRTRHDFQADNGHFLYTKTNADFVLSTTVHFNMVNQFDQAGLMLRFSPDCWLKTSIEYEPNLPNRLGAVVTNSGYSDWSTQDVGDDLTAVSLRITREGRSYIVEYTPEVQPSRQTYWSQLRVATLLEDESQAGEKRSTVQCGLYACSPKGAGFQATFDYLKLE